MFCSTIENLFDEPANLEIFPPNAYIHLLYAVRCPHFALATNVHILYTFLCFQVKRFYKFLLEDVPGSEKMVPVYHRWFIPCVRHWLKEYQHSALLFVNNAWDDDKSNDKVNV